MGELFDLFLALFERWRLGISNVFSIVLALILSNTYNGFTAGYCVILVFVGFCFGLFWANYADKVKK